jgi:hypothetical protein
MSGPWEDFQQEDGPWADFSSGEQSPSVLGKIKDSVVGAGEAALSLATSVPASVYGQAVGFANAARSPYKFGSPEFAKYEGDITQQSTEANTYAPRTEKGQEYTKNVGDVVNDYLLPAGAVGLHPRLPSMTEVRMGYGVPKEVSKSEFEANLEKTIDAGKSAETGPWEDFQNPESPNFYQVRAEDQMRNDQTVNRLQAAIDKQNPQQPTINVDSSGNVVPTEVVDQGRRQAQLDQAQATIEARQRALEEQVARQTSLDQNAAQRQRFENARPAGLDEAQAREQFAIEQQRMQELQDSIRKTQELNQKGQQMDITEDYGNNDPMDRMPNMRVDQNGMPIRADLSMEAQNLENPLQRNLWGDELGPALGQERSMTEAMDQMPPWDRPSDHVGRELNPSEALKEAIRTANEEPTRPTQSGLAQSRSRTGGNQGGHSQMMTDIANAIGGAIRSVIAAGKAAAGKIANFAHAADVKLDRVYDMVKTTPRDIIDNINPALRKGLQDVIPKPEGFSDNLKQKILGEGKDGPSLWAGMQSGALNTAYKVRSALIESVYHWNNYGMKKAEYLIRNMVLPMEKQFKSLSREEIGTTATVLRRELADGKTHTPEQLKAAGMTDRAIKAYTLLRQNFDEALKSINEGRAAFGKDPISGREAYLSSRWSGDWHVPVYDKSGRVVWWIREGTQKRANAALDYLKKQDFAKDLDFDKTQVSYRKSAFDPNSAKDVMGAYKSLLEDVLPNDDAQKVLQDAMEKYMSNETYDFMNTKKHFKNKREDYVRGFEGDKPWLSDKQNNSELLKSQFSYLKEAHRWAATQESMVEIKKFLADKDIQQSQPNNIEYSRKYMQNSMGLNTDPLVSNIEARIAKGFGVSRSSLYGAMNDIKAAFYTGVLGASPGFMIGTVMQGAFSAAYHRMLSAEGMNHNPIKTLVKTYGDATMSLAKIYMKEYFGKDVDVPMSDIGQKAMKYAIDNQLVHQDIYDVNHSLGSNRVADFVKGRGVLGKTISEPERAGRLPVFMSYVHHLDQSGAFKDTNALFQKAEDLTNLVMGDPRRSERPMVFNKLGVLGENIVPLKSFTFSYYNQLSGLIRQAGKGTTTPLLAFMAAQLALGGVLNMPMMNEADWMFKSLKNSLAEHRNTVGLYAKVADIPGPKEAAAVNLPNMLSYGALSDVTGVNLSTRFSTDLISEHSPLASLFPLSYELKEWVQGAGALTHPTEQNIAQAAWQIAPPAGKGAMETHWDVFKTRDKDGNPMKDTQGRQLYQRASDLSAYQGDVARTPFDENVRSLGLRSLNEAKQKDVMSGLKDWKDMQKEAQFNMMNRITDALQHHDTDTAKEFIQDYMTKLGGDARTLQEGISRAGLDYNLTAEQKLLLANQAKMLNVMKMKKYQEAMKDK